MEMNITKSSKVMKINSDPANLDSAKFDDTPTKNTGVDVDDTVLSCTVFSGTTPRPVVFLYRGTSCFRHIEREVALIYFIFFRRLAAGGHRPAVRVTAAARALSLCGRFMEPL